MTRPKRFDEVFPCLAAGLEADAAYREGYLFGRAIGFEAGRIAGLQEDEAAWRAVYLKTRAVLERPSHKELQRRRGEVA